MMIFGRRTATAFVLALSFFAGSSQAQVELISRTHPLLISETGGGEVTSMSADGRYVVFQSWAKNLIPGQQDSNVLHIGPQVFLHDRQTGVTALVSRTSASPLTMGNSSSQNGTISADGRFVLFLSAATNLIAGQNDSPATGDLFLFDRVTGTTTLVSHPPTVPPTLTTTVGDAVISADGRYVAFTSIADDLLPVPSGSSSRDVFLYDRVSGTTSLVSHGPEDANYQAGGTRPAISANGAYVAFLSEANLTGDPLHPGTSNLNLFLYETATGTVSLVSRKSDDPTRRRWVYDDRPAISADGRFIAFTSSAPDLVPGQTEGVGSATTDVFVFDRVNGTMALASGKHGSAVTTGNGFSQASGLSADGRYAVVVSDSTDLVEGQADVPHIADVFLRDLALGTTILVSRAGGNAQTAGNGHSSFAGISADGSHVAFMSEASNLVAGQVTGVIEMFLFERATGTLHWASQPAGEGAPSAERWSRYPFISADGSLVAYSSTNGDLIAGLHDPLQDFDAFVYSSAAEENSILSRRDPASPALAASGDSPLVSADGRFVVYRSGSPLLVPGAEDELVPGLYLYDRLSETTTLISHDDIQLSSYLVPLGISDDGRFVTFQSRWTDVIPGQVDSPDSFDVFSYDRIAGTISLVSRTAASPVTTGMHHDAFGGRPSRDGRYIPFESSAENLVPGQIEVVVSSNVFLHDRASGATELVSHAAGAPAREANGTSGSPTISPDGRYVAFVSSATDLAPGLIDTNNASDLFLHDRGTGTTTLVSHSGGVPGKAANGASSKPVFAGGGRCLVFTSRASDLVAGATDTNNHLDVFLYSLVTGNITLVSRAHGSASTGGNGDSLSPSTGADCSAIAFQSFANNLVPGQAPDQALDLFLAEPVLGSMTLLGAGFFDGYRVLTEAAVVSGDSRFVAFSTPDDLLGGGADFAYGNLYLFDRASRDVILVSRANGSPSTAADQLSAAPSFSADSRFVGFQSFASNLVAGDFNAWSDVFLFDTQNAGSDFYTLSAPCRLVDTRRPEDGPALVSGTPVIFEVDGGCGIPAAARALALNITAFEPAGQGNLSLGPGDAAPSGTSSINFLPGLNKANNAIVPLSLDGSQSIGARPLVSGGGTVHLILDVVGWFE